MVCGFDIISELSLLGDGDKNLENEKYSTILRNARF
jgi:hypothetical protein